MSSALKSENQLSLIDAQLQFYLQAKFDAYESDKLMEIETIMTKIHIVHEGVPPGEEGRNVFITIGEKVITLEPSDNIALELNGDNENGLPQSLQISTSLLSPSVDADEHAGQTVSTGELGDGPVDGSDTDTNTSTSTGAVDVDSDTTGDVASDELVNDESDVGSGVDIEPDDSLELPVLDEVVDAGKFDKSD